MLMKDTSKKKAKKVFARNANARNSNLFNRPSLETMELHSRLDVQYNVLNESRRNSAVNGNIVLRKNAVRLSNRN